MRVEIRYSNAIAVHARVISETLSPKIQSTIKEICQNYRYGNLPEYISDPRIRQTVLQALEPYNPNNLTLDTCWIDPLDSHGLYGRRRTCSVRILLMGPNISVNFREEFVLTIPA